MEPQISARGKQGEGWVRGTGDRISRVLCDFLSPHTTPQTHRSHTRLDARKFGNKLFRTSFRTSTAHSTCSSSTPIGNWQ